MRACVATILLASTAAGLRLFSLQSSCRAAPHARGPNHILMSAAYRRDPADTAVVAFDMTELHDLLSRRSEARKQRDWSTADDILRQLRSRQVDVNDRTCEWRAGYKGSYGSSQSSSQSVSGTSTPALDYSGDPELAHRLGAALLTQWRADGRRRGQSWTHGFHPSKALMEPLCVSQLLALLPGDGAILDPFVGSGTTMLEAMVAGRAVVGCDVSPLSVGIARQHCWRPSAACLDELRSIVSTITTAMRREEEETAAEEEQTPTPTPTGGHEAVGSSCAADFGRAKALVRAHLDASEASAPVARRHQSTTPAPPRAAQPHPPRTFPSRPCPLEPPLARARRCRQLSGSC